MAGEIYIADKATLDLVKTSADRLTAGRAALIDGIGAANDTGGSATAGTAMAKLNKIMADNSVSSTGVGNTVFESSTDLPLVQNASTTFMATLVAKFMAPVAGIYKMVYTVSNSYTSAMTLAAQLLSSHYESNNNMNQSYDYAGNYMSTDVGGSNSYIAGSYGTKVVSSKSIPASSTGNTYTAYFYLDKGEFCLMYMSKNQSYEDLTLTDIAITYGNS